MQLERKWLPCDERGKGKCREFTKVGGTRRYKNVEKYRIF